MEPILSIPKPEPDTIWQSVLYHEILMAGSVPGDNTRLRFATRPDFTQANMDYLLAALGQVSGGTIYAVYTWPLGKYRPRQPQIAWPDAAINSYNLSANGSVSANTLSFSFYPQQGGWKGKAFDLPYLRWDILPVEPNKMWWKENRVLVIDRLQIVLENSLAFQTLRWDNGNPVVEWRPWRCVSYARRDRTRSMARRLNRYKKQMAAHTTASPALGASL